MQTLIPTQLVVGPDTKAVRHVELFLQSIFCPIPRGEQKDGSVGQTALSECFCSTCRRIKNRQHPSLLWLNPEKDYKVEDVEGIFEKAHFSLDDGQSYYFVLEKADTLNNAAANKLLKILEEPPTGYHFILITSNEDALLSTILSRCQLIRLCSVSSESESSSFLNFFYNKSLLNDPLAFEQALKSNSFTDTQSTQLAHNLLNRFIEQCNASYVEHAPESDRQYDERVIEFLCNRLRKPPQSGSSNLFWKNLYLQFPRP